MSILDADRPGAIVAGGIGEVPNDGQATFMGLGLSPGQFTTPKLSLHNIIVNDQH
ncbi:hypothetical protein ACRQ5Q_08465 [Bradyrhizobium sp. PMVTL-01]|uniref:hypothetical protein n=1 Tax=Bradyrhizobium sp. PMVTL-01 TaxID=3434999 RepID=UPI003F6F0523